MNNQIQVESDKDLFSDFTQGKSLARRWAELDAARADIEFQITKWAEEVFLALKRNANRFMAWCGKIMTTAQANALLKSVDHLKLAPTAKEYYDLGGNKALCKLDALRDDKGKLDLVKAKDVVASAKVQSLSINTVMKQKGYVEAPKPSVTVALASTRPVRSDERDAAKLARFIRDSVYGSGVQISKDVRTIVDMYAPPKKN